jgi:hypothetical protein
MTIEERICACLKTGKELPMSVKQHIELNKFFHVYRLVFPFFFCLITVAPIPAIVLVLLAYFTPPLLIWLIPVKCIWMGCTGHMKITTKRIAFWTVRLLYECDTCCAVRRAEIICPNIEVTVEFS